MKSRRTKSQPIPWVLLNPIIVRTCSKLFNLMYCFHYEKKAKNTLPTPILTKSVSAFEEPKKVPTHNENLPVQKSYDELSLENKKI